MSVHACERGKLHSRRCQVIFAQCLHQRRSTGMVARMGIGSLILLIVLNDRPKIPRWNQNNLSFVLPFKDSNFT